MRHAKIVCTLGPASLGRETLAALVRAGMDVARLNTSHGTLEGHAAAAALVREVAAEVGRPVGVLMDLGGPKLRTGPLPGGQPVLLAAGTRLQLLPGVVPSTPRAVSTGYPRLREDVRPGARVLLDDGNIEAEVTGAHGDGLEAVVITGGLLGANKGVVFPGANLSLPPLTPRDREAIAVGVHAEVDYFALSFVREAGDIAEARAEIVACGASIPIIAKIERRQAVENLESILGASDGAMVARGDLGVEMAPEDVPVHQRRIIAAAAARRVPVITATQMLESMITSPRPTRAESSDVAHAVWDFTDALMLSGETAVGRYPVETVAMMDRIIRRAESAAPAEPAPPGPGPADGGDDHALVVALAARRIVESDPNMRSVACFTQSGHTAVLLSKVRPSTPIFAITPSPAVARRLALARSVVPVVGPLVDSADEILRAVDRLLLDGGRLARDEEFVVVASLPVQAKGATNFLKLHRAGEALEGAPAPR